MSIIDRSHIEMAHGNYVVYDNSILLSSPWKECSRERLVAVDLFFYMKPIKNWANKLIKIIKDSYNNSTASRPHHEEALSTMIHISFIFFLIFFLFPFFSSFIFLLLFPFLYSFYFLSFLLKINDVQKKKHISSIIYFYSKWRSYECLFRNWQQLCE